MQLRVYNYNTMDKIKTFEAHTDYIRSAACRKLMHSRRQQWGCRQAAAGFTARSCKAG
jgi:hypothetical protein